MSATAMLWIAGALIACAAIALAAWALFADRARGRRRCPKCWYDMSGAAAPREGDVAAAALRCPECGREITHARQLARTRRRWRWALAAALLLLVATGCFVTGKAKRDGWESVTPTTVLILIAQWSDDPWALQSLYLRAKRHSGYQRFPQEAYWGWQWQWVCRICLNRSTTVSNVSRDAMGLMYFYVVMCNGSVNPTDFTTAGDEWLRVPDDWVRQLAPRLIIRTLSPEQAVQLMAPFLADTELDNDHSIIAALSAMAFGSDVPLLHLIAATEHENQHVRYSAIRGLTFIATRGTDRQRVLEILERLATNDESMLVRTAATQALEQSQ